MHSLPDLDHYDVIHLTTVGRVTGQAHTIEIWFAQRSGSLYLLSGGGNRSDWVRNLIHNSQVRVTAGKHDLRGRARVVVAPPEERRARDAVHDKYAARYHGDLSGWRESALPIAIDLVIEVT